MRIMKPLIFNKLEKMLKFGMKEYYSIDYMALNRVNFFKNKLDIFKIICYNNTMEMKNV